MINTVRAAQLLLSIEVKYCFFFKLSINKTRLSSLTSDLLYNMLNEKRNAEETSRENVPEHGHKPGPILELKLFKRPKQNFKSIGTCSEARHSYNKKNGYTLQKNII